MFCQFVSDKTATGWRHKTACGLEFNLPEIVAPPMTRSCDGTGPQCTGPVYGPPPPPPPGFGPGREAHDLIEEIGFEACAACVLRSAEMNRRGVQGCKDTRDEIIGWFREAEKQAGWLAKWSKAPKAMTIIPMRHWPPLGDPIPWIVDEAIRRAEAKAAA